MVERGSSLGLYERTGVSRQRVSRRKDRCLIKSREHHVPQSSIRAAHPVLRDIDAAINVLKLSIWEASPKYRQHFTNGRGRSHPHIFSTIGRKSCNRTTLNRLTCFDHFDDFDGISSIVCKSSLFYVDFLGYVDIMNLSRFKEGHNLTEWPGYRRGGGAQHGISSFGDARSPPSAAGWLAVLQSTAGVDPRLMIKKSAVSRA